MDALSMAETLKGLRDKQVEALTRGSTPSSPSYDLDFNCEGCHDHGGWGEIGTYYGELTWRVFCTCEEGQRQVAEQEEKKLVWEKKEAEKKISRIFSWTEEPELFRGWTLDTYPTDGDTAALTVCKRYIQESDPEKHSLYFTGRVGRGKTGLAVGVIRALTAQGKVCLFVQLNVYLNLLRACFDRQRNFQRALAAGDQDAVAWISPEQIRITAQGVDVLALDDFGDPDRDAPQTDWVREEVFNLINYRYVHRLPTLITSNLKDGKLIHQFGERTTHRIKSMSHTLDMQGRNLREKR